MRLCKILVVTALLAGGLWGCEEEKIVEVPVESPIQVSVQVTPNSVDTGMPVTVIATVTAPDPSAVEGVWRADAGYFADETADTTTWTAPDDADMYTITFVATDNQNVGIGTAQVAVATYMPTDTPSYVGATTCATCHGDKHTSWSASHHAHAWDSLVEIGVDGNASCWPCHTVGYKGLNADPDLNNGGFDETQVERLQNVQCENCHGPGSQHPSAERPQLPISLDAALCGACHTDEHHPTYDEWQESAHGTDPVVISGATRASCAKCHNGLVAHEYLNDPPNFQNPAEDPAEAIPHTCQVCHDPHGNENPGYLRDASVIDVVLPNAPNIPSAGAGRLCMSCHNGRRSSEDVDGQIQNGSSHFGPHHAVQGDMLAGVNAYEAVNASFDFATSNHILVQDACVTCHTHPHEGDLGAGIPNFTGHTFEPTVEACMPCHGTLTDFEDVIAKEDYDGNGMVEGVQVEVDGLLTQLRGAIISASESAADSLALETDFEAAIGDTLTSTMDQRMAGYNWAFVSFDQSRGVHNATYAIQLLQQSILFINPGILPRDAYILEE